ncbi:MAG: DNA-3-methyladenine glycosylase family protein [Patescibacteria group bacterium]
MIINTENFNLQYTLDSGQCFSWTKITDNEYVGVIKRHGVRIKQVDNKLYIESFPEIDEETIVNYFNLNVNYDDIIKKISKDTIVKSSIAKYRGLRIINQDEYDCTFSYLISSCNNVPKIKTSYKLLSLYLGDKIDVPNSNNILSKEKFYTFPDIKKLESADDIILKNAKLGFRARYIKNTARKILDENIDLYNLHNLDPKDAYNILVSFQGVGDKIAKCILLYSMGVNSSFPIDTWILKHIRSTYKNYKITEIPDIVNNIYEGYAGWAQLYIYVLARKI